MFSFHAAATFYHIDEDCLLPRVEKKLNLMSWENPKGITKEWNENPGMGSLCTKYVHKAK
jgi:hypothetical protein